MCLRQSRHVKGRSDPPAVVLHHEDMLSSPRDMTIRFLKKLFPTKYRGGHVGLATLTSVAEADLLVLEGNHLVLKKEATKEELKKRFGFKRKDVLRRLGQGGWSQVSGAQKSGPRNKIKYDLRFELDKPDKNIKGETRVKLKKVEQAESVDELLQIGHQFLMDCKPTLTMSINGMGQEQSIICIQHPLNNRAKFDLSNSLVPEIVQGANVKGIPRTQLFFLKLSAFWENVRQKKHVIDVSHLCHNSKCLNSWHVCFERPGKNVGRNGCAGRGLCTHDFHCLVCGSSAFG